VLDADALNILGENKTWLAFLPKGSILTPHPKEFERIAGKTGNHFERLQLQREFSIKFGVHVVLKGAFTSVTTPDGRAFFNSTGNPGMATAGSGDVLTGIITGLLAQQYTPLESAILGVYLHGLAGDIAGAENGFEALIAGDIVNSIGKAYLQLADF
jgi:NAD(P)H-hydrate epimerase